MSHKKDFQAALNLKEANYYLGFGTDTLRRLIARGKHPPFYKIGHKRYFKKEDLDAWLAKYHVKESS